MRIKNSPHLTGLAGMINLKQEICMEVLKREFFAHKLYNMLLLVHLLILLIHPLTLEQTLTECPLLGTGDRDDSLLPGFAGCGECDNGQEKEVATCAQKRAPRSGLGRRPGSLEETMHDLNLEEVK